MLIYNKETPILFIIYNRVDTTKIVFDKIKQVEPKYLYIAADGPRDEAEFIICEEVRNIVTKVDWDCFVKTLFHKENIGCRKSVTQAITWFFENEPEGIIIEDDCLPSDSFFGFCSELLEKYRYDERIGHISGSNVQDGHEYGDGTYYFSFLTNTWGWAGWRRVWKNYDIEMKSYPIFEKFNYLETLSSYAPFTHYWKYKFMAHYKDRSFDSWHFQYSYLNLINNRLSIVPNFNLICNLVSKTTNILHFYVNNAAANRTLHEFDEIRHPSFVIPDAAADVNTQNLEFSMPLVKDSSMDGLLFLKDRLVNISRKIRDVPGIIKIPKVIHNIYEELAGPPKMFTTIAQTWKDLHPHWEYRFWDKLDVEKLLETYFPDFIPIYQAYPNNVQRWNALRYLILYQFGGLYVDMDYECIEPVDLLLEDSTCCMGLEPSTQYVSLDKSFVIGNSFMASVPEHKYFKMMIDDMKINFGKRWSKYKVIQIKESTGQFLTTRIYNSYPDKDEITLLPAELVSPLTLDESRAVINGFETKDIENKVEKAFAVHYSLKWQS